MTVCPTCHFAYEPPATGGACPRCALTQALSFTAAPEPIGDFEFIAELGRGAMGTVSLVRQRSLDRLVALKVIATGGKPAEWLEARLLREARASAQLQHPHIVSVHETGQGPGGAFLAMEYCEGGDLRVRLQAHPLPPGRVAELGVKLADALAHAHAHGVLHRDLKPSNILLTAAGEPKISDFGLTTSTGGGELTAAGEIAGSPSYLAPETLQPGARPAPAVDIYGLGAILYECVTGRPPFTGDSAASVLAQIASAEPAAPRVINRQVPPDLETIILKCLEKNPAVRYASAVALRDDLRAFVDGRPIAARPLSAAGRLSRWARRNPALAAASAAILLLLLVVAAGASFAALRLHREQSLTAAERDHTARAEAATREQLRAALLAQAKAMRFTARTGQRLDALAALQRAAAIRPGLDLRTEAIAALTLPDWSEDISTHVWNDPGFSTATPLPGFKAFVHETEAGGFSRRSYPEGKVEWTWPANKSPSAGQTVISPDGRWVAVRLQNEEIHVLDAATGQPKFQLTGRPFAFKASRIWGYGVDMAFSPDGSLFAATRAEGGVTIHRVPDGAVAAEWASPAVFVSLAFSHNGKWLAVGGARAKEANALVLLEAATGRELARDVPLSRVDFVEWSADDRWLAVGSRPVQVRSAADLSVRAVVPDKTALHGRFLPDNNRLLLTEQTGQTRLWEIDSGRLLLAKQDSGRPGMWWDGDPLRQWRYFSDGKVALSTFLESPVLAILRLPDYTVPNLADPLDISPDGRWLALGGWRGPLVLSLRTKQTVAWLETGPVGSLSVARFDATGESLWVGQSNGPLARHDFKAGTNGPPVLGPAEIIAGHDGFLPTALHRATGRLALVNFREGRVRLFDTATRTITGEWSLPRAATAAFSPDGKLVLSNAEPAVGARAEIHETDTGRLVRALGEKAGRIASWSPDGKWVLAGSDARKATLWHTDSWTPGAPLPEDAQWFVNTSAFSPDARLLVLHSDQDFLLVRPETMEVLAQLQTPGSSRAAPGVAFTPDGRRLVIARNDGRIDFWDLAALHAELAKLGLDWRD